MNSMHHPSLATEIGVHGADTIIHFSYYHMEHNPLCFSLLMRLIIYNTTASIRYEVQRHTLAYSRQNQGHVFDTAHFMYMLII